MLFALAPAAGQTPARVALSADAGAAVLQTSGRHAEAPLFRNASTSDQRRAAFASVAFSRSMVA